MTSLTTFVGTFSPYFTYQVQFGHAGACANQASETAVAKNKALKEAGAFVPKSFDELGEVIMSVHIRLHSFSFVFPAKINTPQAMLIQWVSLYSFSVILFIFLKFFCNFLPCRSVYDDLVAKGVIQPAEEVPPPTVPMDYSWARVSMPAITLFLFFNFFLTDCLPNAVQMLLVS